MHLKNFKVGFLFCPILVLISCILVLPETLKERLFYYDGALFAANGAFFLSAFQDLPNVLSSPVNWMWEYYDQYPSLFIRRHPPLLGLLLSFSFSGFGISAVTAKCTIFFTYLLMSVGFFMLIVKMYGDKFLAFAVSLLVISLPETVGLGSSVRADIPCMMFFIWGVYFAVCYISSETYRYMYVILSVLLLILSLYTYQLTMFGVIGLFLFLVFIRKKPLLKQPEFYMGMVLFLVLIAPLVWFTLKFAFDNVAGVLGENVNDLEPFIPVKNRWSIDNWIFYFKDIWNAYPILIIGFFLWCTSCILVREFNTYDSFFVLWFCVGYLGYSLIPAKGLRYAFHFMIAMIPLTLIGVNNYFSFFCNHLNLPSRKTIMISIAVLCLFVWNLFNIETAKYPYVEGLDHFVENMVDREKPAKILYHGALESAFIFYIRKFDDYRNKQVFRTANEFTDPDAIFDDLRENNINYVVFEAENLRKNIFDGIYDRFWRNLKFMAQDEGILQYVGDAEITLDYPKYPKHKNLSLRIYKVDISSTASSTKDSLKQ